MKLTTYYRLTLLLPLLVPAMIVTATGRLAPFGLFSLFFTMGLPYYALPYTAFAILLFIWLGRAVHPRQMVLAALLTPALFVPFAVLGLPVSDSIVHGGPLSFTWATELWPLVFIGGYLYVIPVLGTAAVLRRIGALSANAEAA